MDFSPKATSPEPDELPEFGPSDKHYYLARSLMHEGVAFPEIHQRLLAVGTRGDFAQTVLTDTAIHLIEPLVCSDVAGDRILMRLTSRGLDQSQAENILQEARRRHGKQLKRSGIKSGPLYVAGAAIMLTGAAVCLVNMELGIIVITLGAFVAGFTAWFIR